MPTNITMKNGDVATVGFSNDAEQLEAEALKLIGKYCGWEFLEYYKDNVLDDYKEYTESNAQSYEAQNEFYIETFQEIADTLFEYRTKVFDKKSKLMRKDLDGLMDAIS